MRKVTVYRYIDINFKNRITEVEKSEDRYLWSVLIDDIKKKVVKNIHINNLYIVDSLDEIFFYLNQKDKVHNNNNNIVETTCIEFKYLISKYINVLDERKRIIKIINKKNPFCPYDHWYDIINKLDINCYIKKYNYVKKRKKRHKYIKKYCFIY